MSLGSQSNFLFGAASAAAGGGYQIERSLRFEGNTTTPYLSKNDYAADSNRQTFTLSLWVKKSATVSNQRLFGLSGTNQFSVMFSGTDQLSFYANLSTGTAGFDTAALYRDFSAWYHIVIAFDTTEAGANKTKVYVNGEEPSFTSISQPADNATFYWGDSTLSHFIGRYSSGSSYFYNGYMADIHYVDGQQLNQYDFGKFDANGVWQPIEYTGTYGTNGFHLDFSDNSSASALGTDSSGNGNDWTVNNFVPSATTYGTQYTLSGSTGQFYNNDPASFGADNLFDGSITSACLLEDANSTITFNLSPGIAFNSSFEIYYTNGNSVTTLEVNGVSQTVNDNYSTREWMNVTGVTSPVTSISWSGTNGALGPYVYAVRVDGTTIITDGDPTTIDSLFDSPTNGTQEDTGLGGEVSGNYVTYNPLKEKTGGYTMAYADGNLELSGGGDGVGIFPFGSGKKYFELTIKSAGAFAQGYYGIVDIDQGAPRAWTTSEIAAFRDTGTLYGDGSTGAAPAPSQVGDVIGFAVDVDNQKLFISINGTYLNSADPAAGTGFSFSGRDFSNYAPLASLSAGNTQVIVLNAGQRPFVYAAPSGFKALCTANLDDPGILDGSTQMDSVLYTGDGTAGNTITGLNFAPDLVWLKVRATYTYNHELYDTVRGVGERLLSSSSNAEAYNANYLQQFNSDGFQLGSGSGQNTNGASYVSWTWDAGTSTVSNTDGSITSSVRANPSAGFSIVSYTGTGSNATVGHGLNAAPKFVVVKNRDTVANWAVWHSAYPATQYTELNTTIAATTASSIWNNTEPTSTTFSVGFDTLVNQSAKAMIAYCFAPVEGYSAFGTYTGNGLVDGPFVYTGFSPRWIIVKASTASESWIIMDTARDPYNVAQNALYANSDIAETASYTDFDILSNGFKLRRATADGNATTRGYMYAAFAENPFKTARAR